MSPEVSCAVKNCTFWAKGNRCSADSIHVSSQEGKKASNRKETDCSTFEEEEEKKIL